jgi:hypothetical protein
MATRTDKHIDRPSTVEAGDAPADTTDPHERVSSVQADKAAAAAAGYLTVNAVVPLPKQETPSTDRGNDRTETYQATRPDGTTVTVTHNVDTGESKVGGGESKAK